MSFYAKFLALSEEENRQLEMLIQEDDQFAEAVENSVRFWREHLRALYPDPTHCRQLFLAHTALKSAKCASKHTFGPRVMNALILTLADRVEVRVRQLDRQEGGHGRRR